MSYGRIVLFLGAGLILVNVLAGWNHDPSTSIGGAIRKAVSGK